MKSNNESAIKPRKDLLNEYEWGWNLKPNEWMNGDWIGWMNDVKIIKTKTKITEVNSNSAKPIH